jgi:hypothetical protein
MPEAMLPAVVLILCSERGRSERAGRAGEHAVVDGGVDACGRRSFECCGYRRDLWRHHGRDYRRPVAGPTDSMPRSVNSRSPDRR